ncbi:Manganese transporter [Wickerhamomyces ciferrii]|uniref:Manganese transporter n=1 Tax=Wickerhamomyces ciferrii (strain ATCC 14091 / BCRC 22168 / CBS 111 / JCM 3599 / NBRC 0793 / NRRL Y-1031 F-60-10) TaxID=1206466 RepID=K0KM11_WICCF|nr:Manganese transporter [Wickerhamomyces ciferrii]CCH43242.1 Manganese transporter [Wickerhamomyces ciferrii]
MNFAKLDDESLPKRLVSRLPKLQNFNKNDEESNINFIPLPSSSTTTLITPNSTNHSNEPSPKQSIQLNTQEQDQGFIINNEQQQTKWSKFRAIMIKYSKFIGPGLMVSVSYMDPGNYSTAVAAGSAHKYKHLFSILLSNILAAFLQILCAKLGAVTGLDLAQNCREHLSPKLNLCIYILAEIAIIATDLAEVIGTAISLNILFGLPLILGVVLTIVDVLIVLMFYKPNGDMKIIRIFEMFVSLLVALTVVCFTIELINVDFKFNEVMTGFLPSQDIVKGDGLYLSLAILGATVMPHSLYLGSGLVQPRLRDYDVKNGNYKPDVLDESHLNYKPSMDAINDIMNYTITELIVSLFTVALFVNSAILIVSGSTLSGETNTDLFSIYELLSTNLSHFAGLIFVLALLFSGQSAGIVCTLSGQMISEGFLHWSLPPTLRRLLTRSVAIAPCFILVLVSGRNGLSGALNASQVILSLLLPFVSAPLIYFTAKKEIMKVNLNNNCYNDQQIDIPLNDLNDEQLNDQLENDPIIAYKDMSNSKLTNFIAIIIWLFITCLNFFLIVSFLMGKDVNF